MIPQIKPEIKIIWLEFNTKWSLFVCKKALETEYVPKTTAFTKGTE